MGILFTRMLSSIFGNREARILVLGLDNAGKTTILYRLQMGEVVSTIPTIGFNVETVQYNNIKFQVWDLDEMKFRVVCRKVYDYVRYDLKEIAFPSSLPDPPHIRKPRKLTWKEEFDVVKKATQLYAASWVRDIRPEVWPDEFKKEEVSDKKTDREDGESGKTEPSTLEDLAVAARGGMETLRPALQRLYMTRASAYSDALKAFIQGYQEGLQQVMEMKDDAKGDDKSPLQEDVFKK